MAIVALPLAIGFGIANNRVRYLTKLPEPAIGEIVARAIGRPARRVHLAMGPHRDVVSLDFAAAISQVADQFLAGIELGAGRLLAVEIADEANA